MLTENRDAIVSLLRHQTALAQFGSFTLRSDNLDLILTEACRIVGEALGTDLAKVVEVQPDGHTLLVRAGVGWNPDVVGKAVIHMGDDTSEGITLRTGEPMISSDITLEQRFRYPTFLIENGVRAMVNVVIGGNEDQRPFGVLQVDSRVPHQFDKHDIAFLQTYANLLAAAVIRLRAYKTLVAQRRELAEANAKLHTEAREALHQSQKMEAIGQLTGGLAHDFNNLLGGISGSLELMRARLAEGRTAGLDRHIDTATVATNRAAALIHRLLAFSRRQTLDPKLTDMNLLVTGMEDLFRRTVGPSIEIESRLTAEPWITLCDPHQIETALLNLVVNARDAMPDGGHLLIETAHIVLPQQADSRETVLPKNLLAGDYVALCVTDTGTGMSPSVLERAFDPFFTTKPIGKGTGLGLSMIYGFAQQSGGHVQLRSNKGQGTTVTIYLPRHLGTVANEAEVEAIATELLPSRTGAVVLLVEDEPSMREIILDVLGGLGYKMLEADDGPSGLAILETTLQIDLLITDVGLPGINGRQLADAARLLRPGLRVLFITGYAEGALVEKGVLEKGMQIMTKPFSISVLAARVQGMLGN
jgi:signal transduction histidine kinase/CheY-like chemotaxis protein